MRFTVLFFILIFTLQSQASFLSSMLYKSGIYQLFFWPMSNIPLSIYHDTVEAVNKEISPTVSSTNIDEQDDHQIKRGPLRSQLIRKVKNQKPKQDALILRDSTNNVSDVQAVNTSIQSSAISQDQLVPSVNNQFKTLIDQERYREIFEIGEKMSDEEFLNEICPVVKTLEQYSGVADHLKRHNLVTSFYVYGDIAIVKEAIVESKVYDKKNYIRYSNLESALFLAFKEDSHGRVIELFNVRKEIAAEDDEQLKRKGYGTIFENFVSCFLKDLAPWEDGMAFKRFFTLRADELRDKYPDILNTLCQGLVDALRDRFHLPSARKLLTDLVGQPSLLTPVSFAKGFLVDDLVTDDKDRSYLIKYGWREAIEEGLKQEYPAGGEYLWEVIMEKYPIQFIGADPPAATILVKFPTKQQKEEERGKKNVPDFSKRLDELITDEILPKVIIGLVFEYADPKPTWLEVPSIKS